MGRDYVSHVSRANERRAKMRNVKKAQFQDSEGRIISFNFNNDNIISKQELAIKEKYYDLDVKIRKLNKKINEYKNEITELEEKLAKFSQGEKKSFFNFWGPSTVEECKEEITKIQEKMLDAESEIRALKEQQANLLEANQQGKIPATPVLEISEKEQSGIIPTTKDALPEIIMRDAASPIPLHTAPRAPQAKRETSVENVSSAQKDNAKTPDIKIPRSSEDKVYLQVVENMETFGRAISEQMAKVQEFEAKFKRGDKIDDALGWMRLVEQAKNIRRNGIRIYDDAYKVLSNEQYIEMEKYRQELVNRMKKLEETTNGLGIYALQ